MNEYVGLDVSLEVTHLCILDAAGAVVARGRAASEPEALAQALRQRSQGEIACVVHETGGQSSAPASAASTSRQAVHRHPR